MLDSLKAGYSLRCLPHDSPSLQTESLGLTGHPGSQGVNGGSFGGGTPRLGSTGVTVGSGSVVGGAVGAGSSPLGNLKPAPAKGGRAEEEEGLGIHYPQTIRGV